MKYTPFREPALHLATEPGSSRISLRNPRLLPIPIYETLPPNPSRLIIHVTHEKFRIETLPVRPLDSQQFVTLPREDTRRMLPRHRFRTHHVSHHRRVRTKDADETIPPCSHSRIPRLLQLNQTPQFVRCRHGNLKPLPSPMRRKFLNPLQMGHTRRGGLPDHLHQRTLKRRRRSRRKLPQQDVILATPETTLPGRSRPIPLLQPKR